MRPGATVQGALSTVEASQPHHRPPLRVTHHMKTLTVVALLVLAAPLVLLAAAFWPVLMPLLQARAAAQEA